MNKKNLPKEQEITSPLVFDNINVEVSPEYAGAPHGMPVLFFHPNGEQNAIFDAPNPYDYVIEENKALYESRYRMDQMIKDQVIERDANGIPLDAAEFHNNILSDNVVHKMLDSIEYNCTIIAAQGLFGLIKDYFTAKDNMAMLSYCNDIKSLLGFNRIRHHFNDMYVRYHKDMVGRYIIFETNKEDYNHRRGVRPQYCFDNNVLNTMLNLKVTIINDLAYNYCGFINFIINSNCYNIPALAATLSPDIKMGPKEISAAMDYSFVIGCLNEQAKNDIAKMSDIIEIAVIDALHYFMQNCIVTEVPPVPESMKDIPGIKNYRKFPDGTEIGEF